MPCPSTEIGLVPVSTLCTNHRDHLSDWVNPITLITVVITVSAKNNIIYILGLKYTLIATYT